MNVMQSQREVRIRDQSANIFDQALSPIEVENSTEIADYEL